MNSKYFNSSYWNKLFNKEEILEPFPQIEINSKTKFLHVVYVNGISSEIIDEWISFPNIDALLGYLQYVWIPISFLSLTNKDNDIIVPEALAIDVIVSTLKNSNNIINKDMLPAMEELNKKLNNIIQESNLESNDNIFTFEEYYKHNFSKDLDKFTYFKIFTSPYELGKYVVNEYEVNSSFALDNILKDFNISIEEWLQLCKSIDENNNKDKFIEIINSCLEVLD